MVSSKVVAFEGRVLVAENSMQWAWMVALYGPGFNSRGWPRNRGSRIMSAYAL